MSQCHLPGLGATSNPVFCTIIPPHVFDRLIEAEDPTSRAAPADPHRGRAAHRLARSAVLGAEPVPARRGRGRRPAERTVYDAQRTETLPGHKVRGRGWRAVQDATVNRAYDGLGATFELYLKAYRRHSIDGNGLPLNATVHYDAQLRQRLLERHADGVRRRRRPVFPTSPAAWTSSATS